METPRLDALSGVVLLSDGKGGYSAVPRTESGLYLEGNIKSLVPLEKNGGFWLLAGVNDNLPLLYRAMLNYSDDSLVSSK